LTEGYYEKRGLVVIAAVLVGAMLGACGPAELSQTIDAPDGSVSIDTPDDWSYLEADTYNYMPMSITDEDTAFAKVYYFPYSEGYTLEDCLDYNEEYYGDNIIGDVEETEIGDYEAHYFEYSMVDMGADGSEYNYHGYEYVIAFQNGIVDVDIHYAQYTLEGKIFSPSKGQLELLRSIAETVREN
jgi:hypothetical protein